MKLVYKEIIFILKSKGWWDQSKVNRSEVVEGNTMVWWEEVLRKANLSK